MINVGSVLNQVALLRHVVIAQMTPAGKMKCVILPISRDRFSPDDFEFRLGDETVYANARGVVCMSRIDLVKSGRYPVTRISSKQVDDLNLQLVKVVCPDIRF